MASKIIVDQLEKTGGSLTALTLPTSNASASEFLQNNGSGVLSWASASAGFSKWTPVTATDSTFDLQTGTTKVILEVQAAGGTAGTNSSGYEGGLGASGAYAMKTLTGMTGATDKLDITIGAVAPNQAPGAAANGTTTSVAQAGTASFTTVTTNGGSGGQNAGTTHHSDGGDGGTVPTTGDLNIAGMAGNGGGKYETRGMSSLFGIGGTNKTQPTGADHTGGAASGYGAGGGMGKGTTAAGGSGSAGLVIVWEFK
jgi:hypothetical protein